MLEKIGKGQAVMHHVRDCVTAGRKNDEVVLAGSPSYMLASPSSALRFLRPYSTRLLC